MRRQHKMAPRQWARLVEMLQLLHIDAHDAEQLRAYRLQVKARLYRVNREVLQQMPRAQRREKLHETFESVVSEYSEISGAELPDELMDVPEHTGDDEALALPPAYDRAARALISHDDDGDDNEQPVRKMPRRN